MQEKWQENIGKPNSTYLSETERPGKKIKVDKILKWTLKVWLTGLPWWRSGWESACQCRGHGFEPWSGKIPHATERLGPWAAIAEPARLEPVLHNKRGHDSERPAHRDEEWPPLATTGESPRTETKTQHSQKINIKINKLKKKFDLLQRTFQFLKNTRNT